jgi:hypothetical protein
MLAADREQAYRFDEMLGQQRAELGERLDELHEQATKLDSIGDQAGVRRTRRIIRPLETEVRTIDRMLRALRIRLGPDDADEA